MYFSKTYVPDDNFEAYLETHDASGNSVTLGDSISMGDGIANNDSVLTANISGVTNLNVLNQSIADLTGIEDFASLTDLRCSYNQLTSLDVSQNTVLTNLYCGYNQLIQLNINSLINLEKIDCEQNQLSSVDLSTNTSLSEIDFTFNQLSGQLDVSNCGFNSINNKGRLQLAYNNLSSLILPDSTYVDHLDLAHNNLDTFDLSGLHFVSASKHLHLNNNNLIKIDLRKCHFQLFNCDSNQLVSLDMRNGDNTNILEINSTGNPNLTCISVDDTAYSNSNWIGNNDFEFDPQVNFSDDCASFVLGPTASFSATPTTICLGDAIAFTDTSSGSPTSWSWDFGDGNSSTAQNPTHVYATAGTYDVKLVVTNSGGSDSLTKMGYITINGPPIAGTITGASSIVSGALSYLTTDGDLGGTWSSSNTAVATINPTNGIISGIAIGTSIISYTVTGTGGCSDSTSTLLVSVTSQEVITSNGGTVYTCTGNFTDDGGSAGNYTNNQNYILTICPDGGNLTKLNFTSFDVESGNDYLKIYDGNSNTSPLLGTYDNSTPLSGIISATANNATGCLTFEFYSNSSVTNTGWVAEISCVHPLAKTYVPDNSFEAFLEANGMGDGIANNDSVLTASIDTVTYLNVSRYLGSYFWGTNMYIYDLTGIEDFVSLDTLYCRLHEISSLDVSSCTSLEYLNCSSNQITSLDVSSCLSLQNLNCGSNQLTNLDLSSNTSLEIIYCNHNQLTSLDISSNTLLKEFYCYSNQLTSLDVSSNVLLERFSCNYNQITSLDFSSCTLLEYLQCSLNQLTSIDVTSCTLLETLECDMNQLPSLDVSSCTSLIELRCDENQLTSLDVGSCTLLNNLSCNNNQLISLDLSSTSLTVLNWNTYINIPKVWRNIIIIN